MELDRKNGDALFSDAINKVLCAFKVAYRILEGGKTVLSGYQFVKCLIMFDIKMEIFHLEALLAAGFHMTMEP